MSLTIYRLLTPLGYKQTAVNTPPSPPPKWRRSTYYFIYISIYPEGKQFPVGVGWGGVLLLLLLFLNNFCYSCIENLKGKGGGGKPSAATFNQAITPGRIGARDVGCALIPHSHGRSVGTMLGPDKAAPNCPLHNCENERDVSLPAVWQNEPETT